MSDELRATSCCHFEGGTTEKSVNFQHIEDAISREKELKKWRRQKKENLINVFNQEWRFLNKEIYDAL